MAPSNSLINQRRKKLVFFWENFGPTHDDRCAAVAKIIQDADVIGLQLAGRSETYDWQCRENLDFNKITLFDSKDRVSPSLFRCTLKLIQFCRKAEASHIFLCHYERPAITIAAFILRVLGKKIFLLYDSKFDDYERSLWRELFKFIWLKPYQGAVVASARSRDYLRFLGMRQDSIQFGYNTISLARIRQLAGSPPAPEGVPFEDRHFTIIARFVEKKNLATVLKGFGLYVRSAKHPRRLRLFGSGPLEAELRAVAAFEGVESLVTFEGFQQTEAISRALGSSLAVLLVSKEEQFGFAIIEALAMGVPVLISPACGAHDEFVRSGVNGFIVESHNPQGMAFFMDLLSQDEVLWRKMALAATVYAQQADVSHFVQSVITLTQSERPASL